MTPEQLADLHPRLFHLTRPEAVEGILRHGLLPPLALLDLHGADAATRARALARRPAAVTLASAAGTAALSDNAPLDDRKLAGVLDDGLTPDDWRRMLAERAFMWTTEADLARLRDARLYRAEPRVVLVLDTLALARAHGDRLEIAPINTGQTLYVPARRGRATFAPLLPTDYEAWRRRRGLKAPDRIREVTALGGIPDVRPFLLQARPLAPGADPAMLAARPTTRRP